MSDIPKDLGRLVKVPLRKAWVSESGDFTPWLASEENIGLLGDTIGIELEVEAQEKGVGPFRADILCKDTATDHWVLIENQLERTDHAHLGQLITYAAGLDAVTIVWIAERFTDEHRAALDWLNEATGDGIELFGLEIELWKIGDSPAAPKFNVVSCPNDWTNRVGRTVREGSLTSAKETQVEFWSSFREYVQTNGASFKPTKPLPQNWMGISIGRSGFSLSAVASTWDSESESYGRHELRAELVIGGHGAKIYGAQLEAVKDMIETELGEPLVWFNPENRRSCRIYLRSTVDLSDRQRWPEYHEWLRTKLDALRRVFGPRVKTLKMESEEESKERMP